MEEAKVTKLPFLTKLCYGMGGAGDSVPYNLFFTYFVFYLTNVAGLSPAIAGTVSMIAILWDAVTDPFVGFLSDNSKNPKGRRTPYMMRSIWPLAICCVFLFTTPHGFSTPLLTAYFIFFCLCMWTCYTTYCVPYAALGAELTNDYNERNILRMFVGLLSYPFVALVNSGVMAIIAVFTARGIAYDRCWSLAVVIIVCIMVILGVLSILGTKGHEIKPTAEEIAATREKVSIRGVIKEYAPILKMKQFRRLNYYGLVWLVGYTMFSTVGVYVMSYCANMDPGAQAKFWSTYTIIALICTPIPIIVANKIGKKNALIGFSTVFVIAAVIFYFHGINNFTDQLVWGACVAFSTSAFWGLYYSTVYDCSELLEWTTGKRNEGGVLALAQFIQKLGGAVSTWIVGLMLTAYGYTGTGAESPETIHGILTIGTLIPAILVAISIVLFFMFKLNRKEYEAIVKALAIRREGGEADDSEFRHIL